MDKSTLITLLFTGAVFVAGVGLIAVVGGYGFPNAVERLGISLAKWAQRQRSKEQLQSARQYAELCALIPDADPHGLRNLHCIRLNVENLQENSLVG